MPNDIKYDEAVNKALQSNTDTVPRAAFIGALQKGRELQQNITALEGYTSELQNQRLSELKDQQRKYERLEKSLINLQKEMEARQKREQELHEQLEETENRAHQREQDQRQVAAKLEIERERFNREKNVATEQLAKQINTFEEEKARYTQESKEKLEENTSAFVEEILTNLNKKEDRLSRISFWSAIFGGVVLIAGLFSLIYLSFRSDIIALNQMSWPQIVYFAAKGAVIAGVIGVISRYSYVFSSEYQREALRVADKSHAIKFGQLYVETYGAAADWDRVKDAFANWHGANETSDQNSNEGKISATTENSEELSKALELISTLKSNLK